MTPHVAQKKKHLAIDGRTTRHVGYGVSLRIRKRVEEVFGCMKTVGGLRRTRYRGLDRAVRVTRRGLHVPTRGATGPHRLGSAGVPTPTGHSKGPQHRFCTPGLWSAPSQTILQQPVWSGESPGCDGQGDQAPAPHSSL